MHNINTYDFPAMFTIRAANEEDAWQVARAHMDAYEMNPDGVRLSITANPELIDEEET